MNTQVNPAALAADNATVQEKIRAFLVSELAEWSINPDEVYINGVNDPEERIVIGSTSLTAEAANRVFEKTSLPIPPAPPACSPWRIRTPMNIVWQHRIWPKWAK